MGLLKRFIFFEMYKEFKDGYEKLKEILGVSNLDTFILVDY